MGELALFQTSKKDFMKSNIELLKLLKQNFTQESKERLKNGGTTLGLCFAILMINSYLTYQERANLERLIVRKNVPESMKKHPSFTNEDYWWTTDKEGMEQRILFLNHLISKELGLFSTPFPLCFTKYFSPL